MRASRGRSDTGCARFRERSHSRFGARLARASIAVAVALACVPSGMAAAERVVTVATISGSINPASADYLIKAIEQSETEGAAALIIQLDTPGGLVSSTKDIIQAILNAELPVIVYVGPRGAWAASAGMYITVSAHVAAMAPGSGIGAAHPVSVGGSPAAPPASPKDGEEPPAPARDLSMEKAENMLAAYVESIAKERNRNVEWVVDAVRNSDAIPADEALELGVIDLLAEDKRELLEAIEGREVKVAGEMRTLELAGARLREIDMNVRQTIFNFLSDPNVAVVLFLAALLGLYVEVNNPGLIVPGAIGVACLILTGFAFQILPFSWLGLALILAGVALLVAEVFVASFGILFTGAIVCLLVGGSMLFDRPEVSDLNVSFWGVLVPAVLGVAVFGGIVAWGVSRSIFAAPAAGKEEMVGLVGQATGPLDPTGRIFVRGEYWNVEADESIEDGESVEVVALEGLRLKVRRAESAG